jgi:hypothetical protein
LQGLLAVDVGLHTGLAGYGRDGRLVWYRSTNFGARPRLKAGVRSLLSADPGVRRLAIEGGGDLAVVWEREAERRGIQVMRISAEEWRDRLLLPRERTSGEAAKRKALDAARLVIEWSGAKRPTSLTHDAAEAVLVGLYAVLKAGWLERPPDGLGTHGGRNG